MMRRMVELAGRYRLEEPLGRGGMGEVWRGVDLRLRRPVAVKLLPLTLAAEPVDVARFRREAEVAATLNHPGITTVFDIDEHQDGDERWLFLVMELLIGCDLRRVLARNPTGLPIEQVRELVVQVAGALSAAHHSGVVHRDVTPANLFLLEEGRIKICDFGIARLAGATRLTASGWTAGTALYMAPEQIDCGQVDQRTDLYALGCVLYELLTGATWVSPANNVGAILYQQLNQAPDPPQTVRAEIPDQLNSLTLELLAKRPDARPPTAAAVAERLRRIPARPRPAAPRARRPTAATFRHDGAVTSVAFSPDGKTLATGSASGVARLWDVPAGRTRATLNGHTSWVSSVAPSPDGRILATGSYDDTVRLWSMATGRNRETLTGHTRLVSSVAFSPDGRVLISASYDGTVRLWDAATGDTMADLTGQGEVIISAAFSPDGTVFATGSDDATVRLWGGTGPATLTGHASWVSSVAFSPDGKILASGSYDGTVRLWDVVSGEEVATLAGHGGKVTSVAFSLDGTVLASGGDDGTVRLWDVVSGEEATTLAGHGGKVTSVAFSPHGTALASGGDDGTARLWKLK